MCVFACRRYADSFAMNNAANSFNPDTFGRTSVSKAPCSDFQPGESPRASQRAKRRQDIADAKNIADAGIRARNRLDSRFLSPRRAR